MNHFQYTLAMERLPTLKTKKAKEAFIREIHKEITKGNRWSGSIYCQSEDFYEMSRLYKVYKSAFIAIDKNLPQFLGDTLNALQDRLLQYAVRSNIPEKDVEDALQFDVKELDTLTYENISNAVVNALSHDTKYTLATKLKLISIVRDSLEPS